MTPEDYYRHFEHAAGKEVALLEIIDMFMKELSDMASMHSTITNEGLSIAVEKLQEKWLDFSILANKAVIPGGVPVDPEGFMMLVRQSFPKAHSIYIQTR